MDHYTHMYKLFIDNKEANLKNYQNYYNTRTCDYYIGNGLCNLDVGINSLLTYLTQNQYLQIDKCYLLSDDGNLKWFFALNNNKLVLQKNFNDEVASLHYSSDIIMFPLTHTYILLKKLEERLLGVLPKKLEVVRTVKLQPAPKKQQVRRQPTVTKAKPFCRPKPTVEEIAKQTDKILGIEEDENQKKKKKRQNAQNEKRLIETVSLFDSSDSNLEENYASSSDTSDTSDTSDDSDNSDIEIDDDTFENVKSTLDNILLEKNNLTAIINNKAKEIANDKDNLANYQCVATAEKNKAEKEKLRLAEQKSVFEYNMKLYKDFRHKLTNKNFKVKDAETGEKVNFTEEYIPALFQAKYYVFKYLDKTGFVDNYDGLEQDEKDELFELFNVLYKSKFPDRDKDGNIIEYKVPELYAEDVADFLDPSNFPDLNILSEQDIINIANKSSKLCAFIQSGNLSSKQ
uniref:Uncharacterized protein n=1 Tax=viral metagenome TaxID=1070528 RepID=A0A6C0ED29_9ZZZZ